MFPAKDSNILTKFKDHDYTKSKKYSSCLSCGFEAKKVLLPERVRPFQASIVFLHPHKISKSQTVFQVLGAYRMRTLLL